MNASDNSLHRSEQKLIEKKKNLALLFSIIAVMGKRLIF